MDLCRGDRRISRSCGLMQNPFISLEWEPRDPFGPDRTTPLSLPAIQIKSTSGLMSVPGGRAPVLLLESDRDDGVWRIHSFLQRILSLAVIVYFLHSLASSLILCVWTNVCTTFINFWNHMREEGFVVKKISKIDLKYSLLNFYRNNFSHKGFCFPYGASWSFDHHVLNMYVCVYVCNMYLVLDIPWCKSRDYWLIL